jgi:nitrous oxidase accessory protein
MYADRNGVTGNTFFKNSVGTFFMFSHSSQFRDNRVENSIGTFGIGVGFKECSDFQVTNNAILYNARGIYIDQSPYQPDTTNIYEKNQIRYNTVGIQFHGTTIGSSFNGNVFAGNTSDLANDTKQAQLHLNKWYNNSWDSYVGFDFNKDGIGDTPMEVNEYADKILHYNQSVKFFYGSPAMLLLDFLAKLAPFSEPEILAVDEFPVIY